VQDRRSVQIDHL